MRRLSLLAFLPACWGDNLVIPPDALVEQFPPSTTASPAPGVYRDGVTGVTLTADDEHAIIYYTTDGSTPTIDSEHGPSPLVVGDLDASTEVRFFAQDRDGDREDTHGAAYLIDRLGPPAVGGVATSYAGFGLDVQWAAPDAPGLVDVVVAETTDVAATIPTAGSALSSGDVVGAGTVIYAGAGDHVTIDAPTPGSHTFVVWARYDTGTYSEPRFASAYVVPAAERAELSFDSGAGTGTVVTQPAHATVAVTNVVSAAGTITFDVTVTSGFAGLAFNPKLVATASTNGTFVGDGTITLSTMTFPYVDLGPEAWPDAGAVTRGVSITGATGTVTLSLDLLNTAGVFAGRCQAGLADSGGFLVDRAAATARDALPRPPNAILNERYADPIVLADGRHVVAGTILPSVVSIDPITGTIADTALLGDAGEVSALRLDPSGQRLYALLTDTSPVLIEYDPGTLDERGRLDLGVDPGPSPALVLSRDGRWAAVIASGQIFVVELSSFTIRDADPASAAPDGLAMPAGFASTAVAFSAGGALLVANAGNDTHGDEIARVDLTEATLAFTVFDPAPEADAIDTRIDGFLPITGSPGGFWLIGDLPALTRFNTDQGTLITSGADAHVTSAARLNADGDLEVLAGDQLGVFDTATGAYTTVATLPAPTCDELVAVTPF